MLFSPSSRRKAPFTCRITRSSRKSDWSSLLCSTVCLVLKSPTHIDTHRHTHMRVCPLSNIWRCGQASLEILLLVVIPSLLLDHPKHRHTFCHSTRNKRAFMSTAGLASDSICSSATWPGPLWYQVEKRGDFFFFKSSSCNAEDSFHWSREFSLSSPRLHWSFIPDQPKGEKRKECFLCLPAGTCSICANFHLHSKVCVRFQLLQGWYYSANNVGRFRKKNANLHEQPFSTNKGVTFTD